MKLKNKCLIKTVEFLNVNIPSVGKGSVTSDITLVHNLNTLDILNISVYFVTGYNEQDYAIHEGVGWGMDRWIVDNNTVKFAVSWSASVGSGLCNCYVTGLVTGAYT
jgi:hypothetical protein